MVYDVGPWFTTLGFHGLRLQVHGLTFGRPWFGTGTWFRTHGLGPPRGWFSFSGLMVYGWAKPAPPAHGLRCRKPAPRGHGLRLFLSGDPVNHEPAL